jgi:hypothetical protein
MTQSACIEMGWWFTTAFGDEEIRERLRELRGRQAPLTEIVGTLARLAPAGVGEQMLAEFAELPSVTLSAIMDSWAMADAAGKRFEVESVRPEAPRDFARHRRVRIAIEAEEDVVRVQVSHVASRHASWYAPAVLSA